MPVRAHSQSDAAAKPLHSVEALLRELAESPLAHDHGLRTAALHASAFLEVPLDQLTIDDLIGIGPEFRLFLKNRRYAIHSIQTYAQNIRRLVRLAEERGWLSDTQPIAELWAPILASLRKTRGAPAGVVRYAIKHGIPPQEFSEQHLQAWGEWMVRCRRKVHTVRIVRSQFRRAVVRAGLEHMISKLDCNPQRTSDYGVPIDELPEPLRTDLRSMLTWKQARYAKGRPQWARLRPISAKQLERWVCRIYGFATGIAGRTGINSLRELISEDVVASFVEWALNDRNLSRSSMMKLSMIYGALRHHPDYKDLDLQWFSNLFEELPEDNEHERIERKAAKYLPYDVISVVPERLEQLRRKASGEVRAAWLAHDELLIRWLLTLPWRQRNLREARLGDAATANIFFAELPPLVHIAKPEWVEAALRENPHQKFWLFHFRPDETKTGNDVHGILPRRLIPLLDDYLQHHRPKIVGPSDPGTLFLNREGGALNRQVLTQHVSQLTLDHAGRRVTPHIFRDIFAYRWLEDHPEDYLTLSKILFHRDIKTTLRIYGRNYDESNGVRRIDEWLEARAARKEHKK